ncbi:MAG: glycosyltransferase [Bacteroidota bacterium]
MNSFQSILDILQILILAYFGGATFYLLIYAFAGFFNKKDNVFPISRNRHISIVIPAFKEDPVIVDVVMSALNQDYPTDSFRVIVVADSFQTETLQALKLLPIELVEAHFEFSTKAKSLQISLNYLPDQTDLVLVLDADNIMEDHFLSKINMAFESSFKVIQCHRIAKNTNTSFALLDAISEEVNNNIFRSGHRALGISSALIGSAMVFDALLFRKYIPQLSAIGGFDKELELIILREKVKIEYLQDAYVLDEKVQNAHVFYKQRKRWMYAQFYFFGRDFIVSIWHLLAHRNFDYFDKTLQFSLPPRAMLFGVLFILNILNLFVPNPNFQYCWLGILIMIIFTLLISIPKKFYTIKTLKALISFPKVFFLMILILLKLRGGNKEFIHTEHSYSNGNQTKPGR